MIAARGLIVCGVVVASVVAVLAFWLGRTWPVEVTETVTAGGCVAEVVMSNRQVRAERVTGDCELAAGPTTGFTDQSSTVATASADSGVMVQVSDGARCVRAVWSQGSQLPVLRGC